MELPQDVRRFGDALLDLSNLKLTVNGEVRPLEPKSLRLLQFLIENRHRVAHKEEILTVVWEGVAVSDNALTRAIAQVRKALDDDPKQPRYIETVPTVGYRFIASLIEEEKPKIEPAPRVSRRINTKWFVAALVLVTAVSLAVWFGNVPSQPRVIRMRQITQSTAADLWPSLSPDASQIAFSSNRTGHFELYSKSLAPGGLEHQLTSDSLENIQPAWSPDGQSIAYTTTQTGEIRIIPASGGAPRTVTAGGDSARWSPDGRFLVFRRAAPGVDPPRHVTPFVNPNSEEPFTNPYGSTAVAIVDANQGAVRPLTDLNSGIVRPQNPRWLADGHHVVVSSRPPEKWKGKSSALSIISTSPGTEPREIRTLETGVWPLYPAFSPDGHFVYFCDSAAAAPGIWRARIQWNGKAADAEPFIPIAGADARYLDLSADGMHLAYSRQSGESSIWSISLDAKGAATAEPTPVIQDRNIRNTDPWLSRDGSKLVWTALQLDGWQVIWLANSDGSSAKAWTPASQNARSAQWVGSESKLGFLVRQDAQFSYWVAPTGGSPERVYPGLDLNRTERLHLSRDGTMLAGHVTTPHGQQLVVSGLRDGPVHTITPASRSIGYPCWSPDGRVIAAVERVRGRATLVIVPSAGGEVRTLGDQLDAYFASDWSPDGQRITFAGLKDGGWNIYWISVATGKVEQLTRFGAGSGLGFVRYPSWSPDGKRILYERNNWKSDIYVADLKMR
jgi:Tol biopolymer transport system component/DNA-binding winged helix-turn-helix (wHTH) protein